jgi:hypothetical protein
MIDPSSAGKLAGEASKLAPEIYKDLAKPITQELGNVAGRTVKALLSPIRGLLWGWERIEDLIENGVNQRLEKVPAERRKSPDPEIAVPLVQALSYTAQNETLREMYLNLLANSMDTAKEKDVHPSFVEIIKQMNTLDAKVFDVAADKLMYQQVINPNITIKGKAQNFIGATPEWFTGWKIDEYTMFDISSSLIRLSKFGIIELMFDRTAAKDEYESLKSNPELDAILIRYKNAKPELDLEITVTESVLYVNEYGIQFKNACK